jgi:hypothetical protein
LLLSFILAAAYSAREYASTVCAHVQLQYYDTGQVNVGSSSPQQFDSATYGLPARGHYPMHIASAVNGETMTVYVDGTKVADTILFSSGVAKNFYITAPWEYKNGASASVSNFRIAGFRN